jgi:hypothetical protein
MNLDDDLGEKIERQRQRLDIPYRGLKVFLAGLSIPFTVWVIGYVPGLYRYVRRLSRGRN